MFPGFLSVTRGYAHPALFEGGSDLFMNSEYQAYLDSYAIDRKAQNRKYLKIL